MVKLKFDKGERSNGNKNRKQLERGKRKTKKEKTTKKMTWFCIIMGIAIFINSDELFLKSLGCVELVSGIILLIHYYILPIIIKVYYAIFIKRKAKKHCKIFQ